MDANAVSSRDRKGQPLKTVLCEGCGHVFNDPVPSASELAEFYGRAYRVAYKGAARPRMRQIARNFERVQGFWSQWGHMLRNHRRVLDVGAGSGEFLFFAQSLGYEASGVEPNVGYSAFCRDELGLSARTASIEDLQASEGEYDFIRLNHVVEHLRDPVEALEKIAERLAPDGLIYVEVPNILHYANAKSKGGIFHYGHISNFSPWTLRAAAARAGLVEVSHTSAAMAHSTAAFFRKGDRSDAAAALNSDNARAVAAALSKHAERPVAPASVVARLGKKLARRVAETSVAIVRRTPQAIGRHYVSRLESSGAMKAAQPAPAVCVTPSRT